MASLAFVTACGAGSTEPANTATQATANDVEINGKTPCAAVKAQQGKLPVKGKIEAVEPSEGAPQSACAVTPDEWEPGRSLVVTFAKQQAADWLKSQGIAEPSQKKTTAYTVLSGKLPNQNLSCHSGIDTPSGKSVNVQLSSMAGQGVASKDLCGEAANIAEALANETGKQ
ncbi:hypothetical protein ACIO3O_02415 [Streptomyces sp. NPDC087440]|uniref:hypothetical protein n=1 Tax=Streptomyces sp. NPDC087440 TaxID=3365790 RepID=UPI00381526A1